MTNIYKYKKNLKHCHNRLKDDDICCPKCGMEAETFYCIYCGKELKNGEEIISPSVIHAFFLTKFKEDGEPYDLLVKVIIFVNHYISNYAGVEIEGLNGMYFYPYDLHRWEFYVEKKTFKKGLEFLEQCTNAEEVIFKIPVLRHGLELNEIAEVAVHYD